MGIYLWTDSDGDWDTAGNWTPTGVPGSASSSDVGTRASAGALGSFTVTVSAGAFSLAKLNLTAGGVGNEVGLTIESGPILTTGTLALLDSGILLDRINANNGGTLNIVTRVTSLSREDIDIDSTGVTAGGRVELGSNTISGIDVNGANVTCNFLDNPAGEQSDGAIEYLSGFVSGSTATQQNIGGVSWGDGFIFDCADFTGDTATLNGSTLTVKSGITTVLTTDNISAANGTTFVSSGDEI